MAPRIGQKITQDGKVYHIQNVVPTNEQVKHSFGYDLDIVLTEGEAELRKPIYLANYSEEYGGFTQVIKTGHVITTGVNLTANDLWASAF